jgi:LmbE family N-acetylglucosaminyl deacetylase
MNRQLTLETRLPEAFRDLEGKNVLFAHAHPDDEAVATASAMIALREAGVNVHGATATDGEASTRGLEVAATGGRLRELQAAYQEIGVPRTNQFYLGQPDGKLHIAGIEMVRRLDRIIETYHIHALFSPGEQGFDGHRDHIEVDRAAVLVGRRHALPVWRLNAEGRGEAVVPVNPADKRRTAARHISQLTIQDDPAHPHGFSVPELTHPVYDALLYEQETYDRLVY